MKDRPLGSKCQGALDLGQRLILLTTLDRNSGQKSMQIWIVRLQRRYLGGLRLRLIGFSAGQSQGFPDRGEPSHRKASSSRSG